MKTDQLILCHQRAFEYFGGVPSCVLYDNQAQVRLPSGDLNALFGDFAVHYGFTPRTHRPYRPRTKGKVERMVDYLKDNFLLGRTFAGTDDMAARCKQWLEMANSRVHATTGQKPCDLLVKERAALAPLSEVRPYVVQDRQERRVDAEGFVHVGCVRYSVPPVYTGRRVIVVSGEQQIQVRCGDLVIAEHRKGAPGTCVAAREHVDAMWKYTLEQAGDKAKSPVPKTDLSGAAAVSIPPLTYYDFCCACPCPPIENEVAL